MYKKVFFASFGEGLFGKFAQVGVDMCLQFGRVDNADIIQQTRNKTPNTMHRGNLRVEQPMVVIERTCVALGKRILLDKQIVSHHTEAELYARTLLAVHAEDVDKSLYVR